jgi:magnesium-transporting ATPase (P-type)
MGARELSVAVSRIRIPVSRRAHPAGLESYWALKPEEPFPRLRSGADGLSSAEADDRLHEYGPNELKEQRPLSRLRVLLAQLRSPLLLILVFAAVIAGLLVSLVVLAALGFMIQRNHVRLRATDLSVQ